MMRRAGFILTLFLFGGCAYCLVEVLFRGYTHPSMLLLGGVCFLMIGGLRKTSLPFAGKMALSAAAVTGAELLCGLIVNRALSLSVWDYSDLPWNLCGQVCVTYSAAWCLLSVPAMGLHRLFCRAWRLSGRKTIRKRSTETPCRAVRNAVTDSTVYSIFQRALR